MSKFLDLEGLGYCTGLVKGRYDPQITLLRTFMAYVGYAEIEKVEKRDDEGRMTIWYHAYYSGNDTVSYGCLVSRELPIGTALTVENAEVDYNVSVAYTTFVTRDLLNGFGVSLKPYIEISGERHYGVQQRYFYNDLV